MEMPIVFFNGTLHYYYCYESQYKSYGKEALGYDTVDLYSFPQPKVTYNFLQFCV